MPRFHYIGRDKICLLSEKTIKLHTPNSCTQSYLKEWTSGSFTEIMTGKHIETTEEIIFWGGRKDEI